MATPAVACGPDSDCVVGQRFYRIAMPEGHDGAIPVGAVVWSHGYRGSTEGVMRNTAMRKMLSQMNLALIAAQGVGGTWDLPNGPRTMESTGAAEFGYFEAVIEDATARYAIDRDRLVASGFSAGGMMVWNLACARPDLFTGFVPFSGTFWLEPPETCASPVASIVHIHGDADSTVPLAGRPIGVTHQGDVDEVLEFYGSFGGFGAERTVRAGSLTCESRRSEGGALLQFCLFQGGHSFAVEHLRYGIEQLREVGAL